MLKKISFPDFKKSLFRLRTRGKTGKIAEKTCAFSDKARPCQRLHSPLLQVSGEWKYNVLACQCRVLHLIINVINMDKREFPVPNATAYREELL